MELELILGFPDLVFEIKVYKWHGMNFPFLLFIWPYSNFLELFSQICIWIWKNKIIQLIRFGNENFYLSSAFWKLVWDQDIFELKIPISNPTLKSTHQNWCFLHLHSSKHINVYLHSRLRFGTLFTAALRS